MNNYESIIHEILEHIMLGKQSIYMHGINYDSNIIIDWFRTHGVLLKSKTMWNRYMYELDKIYTISDNLNYFTNTLSKKYINPSYLAHHIYKLLKLHRFPIKMFDIRFISQDTYAELEHIVQNLGFGIEIIDGSMNIVSESISSMIHIDYIDINIEKLTEIVIYDTISYLFDLDVPYLNDMKPDKVENIETFATMLEYRVKKNIIYILSNMIIGANYNEDMDNQIGQITTTHLNVLSINLIFDDGEYVINYRDNIYLEGIINDTVSNVALHYQKYIKKYLDKQEWIRCNLRTKSRLGCEIKKLFDNTKYIVREVDESIIISLNYDNTTILHDDNIFSS